MISLIVAALAAAQAPAATAVDYQQDSSWICLPGRADTCARGLPTIDVNPNGYGTVRTSTPAKSPAVDCFYVYPTISRDAGLNSDLSMGEETGVVLDQFTRFASACRTFAPKYRQMTVGAVAAFSFGQDITAANEMAYGDVLAAWRDYITHRNQGRPFVLIGHSQGSLHLIRLISEEIEKDPAIEARMKLAILAGFNILVPEGKLVGGTFKRTPLCSDPKQTGCVIAWTSYREGNSPPEGALFGISSIPNTTVACVNPAAPGSKKAVPLDSVWLADTGLPVPGGPISWSSEGPPPTPWVRTPGLASGQCVNDGPRGYFKVHTNADPSDRRTDRIGGEVAVLGMFLPGWGMHLSDLALVEDDLVRRVASLNPQARIIAQQAR